MRMCPERYKGVFTIAADGSSPDGIGFLYDGQERYNSDKRNSGLLRSFGVHIYLRKDNREHSQCAFSVK